MNSKKSEYEQAESFITTIREMIQHENILMNQRLTWMWTLHGFLFGITAFLWNSALFPLLIIAVVGLLSCITTFYTCNRALNAIKRLLKKAKEYKKDLPKEFDFPPIIGSAGKAKEWLLPAVAMPATLGFAWIVLLIYRIFFYVNTSS